MTGDGMWSRVEAIVVAYREQLTGELDSRIAPWPVDLTRREVHEVVGALLARQVTLGGILSTTPGMWNGHIAPMVLRALVEVHIALSWILDDPVDRSRKFIHYGLGQQKLNLEHRAAQIEEDGGSPDDDPMVQAGNAWLASQRFPFLTEINLGGWSGLSVREMAQEADCLGLMRYAYQPFSAAVHSMWHHVARYNLIPCDSPLHRHHSLPWIAPDIPDVDYVYRGAKYVERSFSRFEAAFDLAKPDSTAFETLVAALTDLRKTTEDDESSQPQDQAHD